MLALSVLLNLFLLLLLLAASSTTAAPVDPASAPPPPPPPTTTTTTTTEATTACKDFYLVSARGIKEAQGPSMAFGGMIAQTLAALSGMSGAEIDVVYPATASILDTAAGVRWVLAFLSSTLHACPTTKFALLGYSQGALLHTMAATSSLRLPPPVQGTNVTDAIRALVFAGNPLRAPHRAQSNVDELGHRGEDAPNAGASGETVLDYPPLFDRFVAQGRVMDICWAGVGEGGGDPICDATGTGGLTAHRKYGDSSTVQHMGAAFLIQQLTAA